MEKAASREHDIKRICDLLCEVWQNYPHLRLMQLLGGFLGEDDHFHRSDVDVLLGLESYPDRHPNVEYTCQAAQNRDTVVGLQDLIEQYEAGRASTELVVALIQEVILPLPDTPHTQLELFPNGT